MTAIAEENSTKLENSEYSTPSFALQPLTLRAPLMPVWIPPRVSEDSLHPSRVEPQLGKTKADEHADKAAVLESVMFELTLACNLNCIHLHFQIKKPY